jgi:hypothetical protein
MGHIEYVIDRQGNRVLHGWDPEMAGLISWFEGALLPKTPYDLFPGLRVIDPVTFYETIHLQITTGVDRPHAKLGFLRATLRSLYSKFG